MGYESHSLGKRVLRSSVPAKASLLQRKCNKCRKKKLLLQRVASGPAPESVPPIVHEVLRSPGQPLDLATRAFMEPRFGHDFSQVRVHADAKAAESARILDAQAYTIGNDIVFERQQCVPNKNEDGNLLVHELSHVVQFNRPHGSNLNPATTI